ncbi:MAG: cyclic pyranopterin monophosphate synthase MoaC [Acidobacteriia bacterium]|nr:cyclic pyranopterin monophosphate synthase MoaC [Terriglobia bacterium]
MHDPKLSHVNSEGAARMVDVSEKPVTRRQAIAESYVKLSRQTMALITEGSLPKGDALGTARLAGIMAAKRTPDLVPLCHPLLLTHVDVRTEVRDAGVRFEASISAAGQTGVEMEALTAASVAALTLYDMVKAVEKGATIERIRLLEKSGGKSGAFRRKRVRPAKYTK